MIIKANSRANGRQLGAYLLIENDGQRPIIWDQRGTLMNPLAATFHAWEKEACATTKVEKPLYHMQIRLAPSEVIDQGQWLKIVENVETRLDLTGHPRVIVAHYLRNEPHLHVVYSRLDRDQGTILKMSHDRRHMHDTARQMEQELGLQELDSAPKGLRNGNQKTRAVEYKMAKESGVSRSALCDMVKAAWEASTTGRQFEALLASNGMHLTPGERRDYNLWHAGKRYDPVRLLEEVRAAEFRVKMRRDPPICRPVLLASEQNTGHQEPTQIRAKHLTHHAYAAELIGQTILAAPRESTPQLMSRQAKHLTAAEAARLLAAPPPATSWEGFIAQRAAQDEEKNIEQRETPCLDL